MVLLPALTIPIRYLGACLRILRTPALLLYCLIPYGIGIFTFTTCLFFSVRFREPISDLLIPDSVAAYSYLFSWLTLLVSIIFSALLSLVAVFAFAEYYLEKLIDHALHSSGLNPAADRSRTRLQALWHGVIYALKRLLIYTGLTALIFILSFFPPLAALVFLLTAIRVGLDIIELPLERLGLSSNKSAIITPHITEIFLLGVVFMCLMLIPLGGVLFLPVAYLVAVGCISRWTGGSASQSQTAKRS